MPTITAAEIDEAIAGQTLATRFLLTSGDHADQVALRARDGDGWRQWTYGEYAERVAASAGALEALGVQPGDRVVLMMRNVPEFHVVDLATVFCGATPISIYNSSSPDQIAHLAGHCGARLAIVEDGAFLDRFEKARGDLPRLEHIAVLDGSGGDLGHDAVMGGRPLDLEAAADRLDPEALVTVIYTSGTTGPPKGVMITHRNVLSAAEGFLRLLDVEPVGFKAVSYLPMAHIAERMSTHYLALAGGYEVTTCPEPGQIADYCRQVRPNIMFGVPRVWEKIHAGVQAALSGQPDDKAKLDEAIEAAQPIAERKAAGTASVEDDETWAFLDEVAFSTVRQLVGFDELRYAVTGAAPIPPELIWWYRAIGVPLSEIYGMSESTGTITWEPERVRVGTVGVAFPGVEIFLADDGEVCARGGCIFPGYLDDPEKTAEALEADGTLQTGDIGEIDDDGYLRIVDRKKELIITAGGKNISPSNLEAALKLVPLIGQAAAIGDQRPFVSALVVLDADVAPGWAKERGITYDSLADLAANDDLVAEIEAGVADVMARFNNAERVKKVTVLPDEWLPDSEELTPTSKLKRRGIHAKYAEQIEAMYAS